jgi:alkanesulfonate monooxygenase SsuD/methylene tetrahydromethanopterin reductase-like flavin-dependent oxidoreductase (luciferase family)
VIATYEQADDAVAAWFAAGADEVNLVLPPNRPEDELTEMLRAAARIGAATNRGARPA